MHAIASQDHFCPDLQNSRCMRLLFRTRSSLCAKFGSSKGGNFSTLGEVLVFKVNISLGSIQSSWGRAADNNELSGEEVVFVF